MRTCVGYGTYTVKLVVYPSIQNSSQKNATRNKVNFKQSSRSLCITGIYTGENTRGKLMYHRYISRGEHKGEYAHTCIWKGLTHGVLIGKRLTISLDFFYILLLFVTIIDTYSSQRCWPGVARGQGIWTHQSATKWLNIIEREYRTKYFHCRGCW